MAASIYDWSLTAASNSNADSDIAWPEGQAPSTVNNSARAMMQRVKELLVDLGGSLAAGGTANGLTVTAESPFSAYADGQIIAFRATANNTGAATLSVNGIGTKAIRKMSSGGDVALVADDITNTGLYVARYSAALNSAAGAWLLSNVGGITDSFSGLIMVPTNRDYKIVVKSPFGGTISETVTICASGTATATFKINTSALGGTANAVSSSEQTQAHSSANVFVAGDDIVITVSANASCLDMSYTIKYVRGSV